MQAQHVFEQDRCVGNHVRWVVGMKADLPSKRKSVDLILVVPNLGRDALLLGIEVLLDLLVALLVEETVLCANSDTERCGQLLEITWNLGDSQPASLTTVQQPR